MTGIQFVTDEKGRKMAVHNRPEKHKARCWRILRTC